MTTSSIETTTEVLTTIQEITMEKITTTIQKVTTAVTEAITTTMANTDVTEATSKVVESTVENGFSLLEFISNASDFANVILAILVSCITIWAFVKTHVSRDVRFLHWSSGCGIYDGYRISVALQSKCLSALSIIRVDLIADEEEIILKSVNCCGDVGENEPIVLEPYKTINITSDSSITPLLEKNSLGEYNNIELRLVFFDGKTKNIKFKSPNSSPISKNMKQANRKSIEGVLCTEYLRYVIKVINPDGKLTIHSIYGAEANGYGTLKDSFYNIKCVASTVVENEDTVKQFFENVIGDKRYIVEVIKNDNFVDRKNKKTSNQVEE